MINEGKRRIEDVAKWMHVKRDRVMPFSKDDGYTSRMLLDEDFLEEAGRHPVVQVNEGTFAPNPHPNGSVACCAHDDDEIYVVLEGDADIILDGECIHPAVGDVIYIPAGVSHGVRNRCADKPFRIMTLWMNGRANDMYYIRKAAWGKVDCMIDEQQ